MAEPQRVHRVLVPADTLVVVAPSTRESVSTKARRLLCEGRVAVRRAATDTFEADVHGDTATYRVRWRRGGGWWCSCPSSTARCSHAHAVALVAGVGAI